MGGAPTRSLGNRHDSGSSSAEAEWAVWAGRDLRLGRDVAVKLLIPAMASGTVSGSDSNPTPAAPSIARSSPMGVSARKGFWPVKAS